LISRISETENKTSSLNLVTIRHSTRDQPPGGVTKDQKTVMTVHEHPVYRELRSCKHCQLGQSLKKGLEEGSDSKYHSQQSTDMW